MTTLMPFTSTPVPLTEPSTADRVRARRRDRQHRWVLVVLLLVAVVIALFMVNLCVGERSYSPAEAIRVILGQKVPGAGFTIGRLRLPRASTAVLAGAAFGGVGACFQILLRNTLASPDIIGITAVRTPPRSPASSCSAPPDWP